MVKLKKEWQIMIESKAIKKAIKHFECMKNDAVVVLDSGFGTHLGESDLVYRNRKMYAELAINALEKQIPKKPHKNFEKFSGVWCSCGKYLGKGYFVDKPSYCTDCGQKLDWSDKE